MIEIYLHLWFENPFSVFQKFLHCWQEKPPVFCFLLGKESFRVLALALVILTGVAANPWCLSTFFLSLVIIPFSTKTNLMYEDLFFSFDHNNCMYPHHTNLKCISVYMSFLGIGSKQSNGPKVQTRITLLWSSSWLWDSN